MTIREQFAGMALQGLLAGRSDDAQPSRERYAIAYEAVAMADSLISTLGGYPAHVTNPAQPLPTKEIKKG